MSDIGAELEVTLSKISLMPDTAADSGIPISGTANIRLLTTEEMELNQVMKLASDKVGVAPAVAWGGI
ncbi:hypothetical protein DDR33_21750 [Pararcticibacter amylolyticus]|uniref:Uncharacterized protein n=1 Tax=Pararcticibacter amylolyticus TaxID=2173175 RepID=A0A2U2PB55_9SPHI|nr:hypothetical protein DDR33_21750 [Pararcticibacter amylolyticus]